MPKEAAAVFREITLARVLMDLQAIIGYRSVYFSQHLEGLSSLYVE